MGDPGAGVMAGHGEYARRSRTQHGAAALGVPLIGPAVAGITGLGARSPALVADFGAAQGTNSLAPVAAALDALRAGHDGPIIVVHADIPGNDFTTLCETLEGSPESYRRDHPDVLAVMAGRSLYTRFLPPGRLELGWTASTLHWLSAAPSPVDGHFFAQLSRDATARAAYAARSAADWTAFLAARAVELAPGAGVVFVDVAMDDDGLMGSEALFDVLGDALDAVAARGLIRASELPRMVYPAWFRSEAEVRAPFAPHLTAATGERLELAEYHPVRLADPFAALLTAGDAEGYAAAQAGFLEGFLAPSFAAALDDDRSAADRDRILAAVWDETRSRIAADPARVAPDYRLMAGRIRRVS